VDRQPDDKSKSTPRRSYRTPRLVRLGTLTDITKNLNDNTTTVDNVHSQHKTS
jgi:hypothetical protein